MVRRRNTTLGFAILAAQKATREIKAILALLDHKASQVHKVHRAKLGQKVILVLRASRVSLVHKVHRAKLGQKVILVLRASRVSLVHKVLQLQ
jgi:hypothetical protein